MIIKIIQRSKVMNNTIKIIEKRFACRSFDPNKTIGENDLQVIAQAALQSPSSYNSQNWQVIFVKNRDLLVEIEQEGLNAMAAMPDKTIYERIQSRGGKIFYDAPCLALLTLDPSLDKGSSYVDIGILSQNIALSATAIGLDTCHCAIAKLCFSTTQSAILKTKLQFPKNHEFAHSVILGYGTKQGIPHETNNAKITII